MTWRGARLDRTQPRRLVSEERNTILKELLYGDGTPVCANRATTALEPFVGVRPAREMNDPGHGAEFLGRRSGKGEEWVALVVFNGRAWWTSRNKSTPKRTANQPPPVKFSPDDSDPTWEGVRARSKGEGAQMYEIHFGLNRRPFRLLPDSSSYYPATGHEQALGRLLEAVQDGEEGLLLLTGEPGTGKTVLCHCLLTRAGVAERAAFVTNSR